jgi:tetratricopeptide (TPR) repeat protein
LDESGDAQRVLIVSAGAVLVEYVPVDDRGLHVIAPNAEFDVVGTVFYVDARDENTQIGVLTGAVQVAGSRVEGGQVLENGAVRPLAPRDSAEWAGHVDVAMHEVRLEASAARLEPIAILVPELEEPPRSEANPETALEVAAAEHIAERASRRERSARTVREEPSEEVEEIRPSQAPMDLRAEAETAMAQSRWQDAATAYESLIRAGDGSSGTRLDLARLYLRQLDMPDRALPHLRRFVQDNPADSVNESARRELCRIAEIRGMQEPLCAP